MISKCVYFILCVALAALFLANPAPTRPISARHQTKWMRKLFPMHSAVRTRELSQFEITSAAAIGRGRRLSSGYLADSNISDNGGHLAFGPSPRPLRGTILALRLVIVISSLWFWSVVGRAHPQTSKLETSVLP